MQAPLSPRPLRVRSNRGFSLLEVLVAFVILSLVATALFRLFGASLANVSAADDYSRALLVAESVLAETAAAKPLREGARTGSADDGRIGWTARVVPWSAPGIEPEVERASEAMTIRLFRVSVDVTFPSPNGGQRSIALATTRIGARSSL